MSEVLGVTVCWHYKDGTSRLELSHSLKFQLAMVFRIFNGAILLKIPRHETISRAVEPVVFAVFTARGR